MKEENCIFCKIANGEIPSATVYEDEMFRVILDIAPASKGHALILPKEHYADLFAVPDETAAASIVLAKKIMIRMKEIVGCDGYNLVQNNGMAAGQTVFHYHVHMIPRFSGDNLGLLWKPGELDNDVRDKILEGFGKKC